MSSSSSNTFLGFPLKWISQSLTSTLLIFVTLLSDLVIKRIEFRIYLLYVSSTTVWYVYVCVYTYVRTCVCCFKSLQDIMSLHKSEVRHDGTSLLYRYSRGRSRRIQNLSTSGLYKELKSNLG